MICLIRVTEGPASGKQCWLRDDQQLSVGRLSTSGFSVPADLHMSRRHLMLEGNAGRFRMRDTGSSNGTFLNDCQVTLAELCEGDRIRAGVSVMVVSFQAENEGRAFRRPDPDSIVASESGAVETDDSPTRAFSADEIGQVPVRSLAAAAGSFPGPYSGPTPSRSGSLPGGAEADGAGGIAELTGQNPPPPVSPVSGSPGVSGGEDLRLGDPSSLEKKLLKLGFLRVGSGRIRELAVAGPDRSRQVLAVLSHLADTGSGMVIVNTTQLDPGAGGLPDSLLKEAGGFHISQTLVAIPWSSEVLVTAIIRRCIGHDALIGAGRYPGAHPVVEPAEWAEIADIAGFPSMLLGFIQTSPAEMEERLNKLADWIVLEDVQRELVVVWTT